MWHVCSNKRYPIMHEKGKLGWAKVVKTLISFIGSGVNFSQALNVGGYTYTFEMLADWTSHPLYGRNVFFNLTTKNNVVCQVSCWFDVNDLEILEIEPHPDCKIVTFSHQQTINHLIDHLPELTTCLLALIATPFEYRDLNHGADPRGFFKGPVVYLRLKAALVRGKPVLLAFQA